VHPEYRRLLYVDVRYLRQAHQADMKQGAGPLGPAPWRCLEREAVGSPRPENAFAAVSYSKWCCAWIDSICDTWTPEISCFARRGSLFRVQYCPPYILKYINWRIFIYNSVIISIYLL
jgi:hypothetical protein